MKRIILLLFVISMACQSQVWAAFLRDVPLELKQPDGSVIKCFITGDEFYRRVHDAQGYTIIKNPKSGWYVYASKSGEGISATDLVVGIADPEGSGISPELRESDSFIQARVDSLRALGYRTGDRTNNTGQLNNVMIFVKFSDQTDFDASRNYNYYYNLMNNTTAGNTSMHNYFLEDSNNQLSITSYLYPGQYANGNVFSFTDTHSRNYYCPYDSTNNHEGYQTEAASRSRERALITAAANYLESNNLVPDALNIDNDNDGFIDNFVLVVRGAPTGWSDLLWPHRGVFALAGSINGKSVAGINLQLESYFNVSVNCHEMSHSLGYPDLYHYTGPSVSPTGNWDLMDGSTSPPQHHLVYTKFKYGHWCPEPSLITSPGTYTLNASSTSAFSAYKIASSTPNQFYIVEYRKKEGVFENALPGSGLIVYRVNSNQEGNEDPPDEIWIYRPGSDNNQQNGDPLTAFYSAQSGRRELNEFTNPRPYMYASDSVWQNDTAPTGNLVITNVGTAGATISFTLGTATSKAWVGQYSDNWNQSNNWSGGVVPTSSDLVFIRGGCLYYPVITNSVSCKGISTGVGSFFTINGGTLNTTNDLVIRGSMSIGANSTVNTGGSASLVRNSTVSVSNATSAWNVTGNVVQNYGADLNVLYGTLTINGKLDIYGDLVIRAGAIVSAGGNFILEPYGTLTVNGSTLTIGGKSEYYGAINIEANAVVNTTGDVFYYDAATGMMSTSTSIWNYSGNVLFGNGTGFSSTTGVMNFVGATADTLYNYTNNSVGTINVNKSTGSLSYGNGSSYLVIEGNFNILSGAYYHRAEAKNVLLGNFSVSTGAHYYFEAGGLDFRGVTDQNVSGQNNGSYYHDFIVDNQAANASVKLYSAVIAKGNMWIRAGKLNCLSNSISVEGNWDTYSISTGFIGSGAVTFNGIADQTCSGENFGQLILNKPSGTWTINSSGTVNATSYHWIAGALSVGDNCHFIVADMVDNAIRGTINLGAGTIELHQDAAQSADLQAALTIDSGTFTVIGGNGTRLGYGASATLNLTNATLDIQNPTLQIVTGYPVTVTATASTIQTTGNFLNDLSGLYWSGTDIRLYGGGNVTLRTPANSYYKNLIIAKNPTSTIATTGNLDINGNFSIYDGIFTAPAVMQVSGNWLNLGGISKFIPGTGSVELNGTQSQSMNESNNFYTLIANMSSGYLLLGGDVTQTVTCARYTQTNGGISVQSGTFTANDLTRNGIYGTIYLSQGSTINLHQDTAQWIDLNCQIFNYGGILNIYGGQLESYWAYDTNASITMTAGTIDFKNKGIVIQPNAYTLTLNLTGGNIRTVNGINDTRGSLPLGCNWTFYGTGNASISLAAGSYLGSVTMSKSAARNAVQLPLIGSSPASGHGISTLIDNRVDGITPATNLSIHGILNIATGVFDMNGKTIDVWSNVNVSGTFKMITAATLSCGGDFTWYSGCTTNVSTGNISCTGVWAFNAGSAAQLTGCQITLNAPYGGNILSQSANSWMGSLILSGVDATPAFSVLITSTVPLGIHGSLTLSANNALNLPGSAVTVSNAVDIAAGATLYIDGEGSLEVINGVNNHGYLNIVNGGVAIHGMYFCYNESSLSLADGSFTNDNPATGFPLELRGRVNLSNGAMEFTSNSLVIHANALSNYTGGILRTGGSFTATEVNAYMPSGGELQFTGTGDVSLTCSNGSWINKLVLNKSGAIPTLSLQSDIIVKTDVLIQTRRLITNNHNITVGGSWVNSMGWNGFTVGTGTVTFNQNGGIQLVGGSNTFYIVVDAHAGGALEFLNDTTINTLAVTNSVTFDNVLTATNVLNNSTGAMLKFCNAYTSSLQSYDGGGSLRAESGHSLSVNDVVDAGLFGSFIANNATLNLNQDAAQYMDVNGNLTISNNGSIYLSGGGTYDYDIGWAGNSTITMDSGILKFLNKGVRIPVTAYAVAFNFTGGTLKTQGNLNCQRTTFAPAGGTVECLSSYDSSINLAAGSSFYHLKINKSSDREENLNPSTETLLSKDGSSRHATRSNTMTLSSAIIARGDITIQTGTLASANYDITLNGYWSDNAGAGGFTEGTGRVTFGGPCDISGISTDETFYNLTLNNPSTSWDAFTQAGQTTVNVLYNLTITDGTYLMEDGAILTVGNNLIISSGAGLNPTSSNIRIGHNWTDANTTYSNAVGFNPQTSTLTFNGALEQTITTSMANFNACNLVVNKTAGVALRSNKAAIINGDFTLTSGIWNDLTNGWTHDFYGNYSVGANGVWSSANLNTVRLRGSSAQTISYNGTSGNIYNLSVDKTAATTATLGSNLTTAANGNLTVNTGIFSMPTYNFRAMGNVVVNNTGKLNVSANGILTMANGKAITVNNGGMLEAVGTPGNPAKITRNTTGNYTLSVESGGTLGGSFATFEYMGTSGVELKAGSLIDAVNALNNCTFQLGAAAGKLLTINNSQTVTISNAIFPANTWSGSYNVYKNVAAGNVTFAGATGGFAGAAYESDINNRIAWLAGNPDLQITAVVYSSPSPYVCDPVTVTVTVYNAGSVNATTPFNVDLYYNRATAPTAATAGDLTYAFASLAVNAYASYTFTNVNNATAGVWRTYAQVDRLNAVTETNEANNISNPVTETWQALPAISNLTSSYLPGVNQIRLTWSYPLSVYRYNIYKDSSPNGAFSTLAGRTTTGSFTEQINPAKMFYRVKAERVLP